MKTAKNTRNFESTNPVTPHQTTSPVKLTEGSATTSNQDYASPTQAAFSLKWGPIPVLLPWLSVFPTAIAMFFMLIPFLALVTYVRWAEVGTLLLTPASQAAIKLSLFTTTVATGICFLVGLPLTLWITNSRRGIWVKLVQVAISLPMVLPPVVAGLVLLITWGRRGLLGKHLDAFGIEIGFTTLAVVIAQVFVALPFFVTSLEGALQARGFQAERTAQILGATPWRTLVQITLPLSFPAVISSICLSFARALGEFGATLTFAGSLQGVTRTLPLEIYLQRENDTDSALVLSLLLLAIALILMGFSQIIAIWGSRPGRIRRTLQSMCFWQRGGTPVASTAAVNADLSPSSFRDYTETNPHTSQSLPVGDVETKTFNLTETDKKVARILGPSAQVKAMVGDRGINFDLTISGGVMTALIGPNGAGKSTLVSLLAGTLIPQTWKQNWFSGLFLTLRKVLAQSKNRQIKEHSASLGAATSEKENKDSIVKWSTPNPRIVLLAQNPSLFPHFTLLENVAFPLRCRGIGRIKAQQRALIEMDNLGIADLANRLPDQVSGGQAQRAAIARAFTLNPEVILFDEPFAGIDVESAQLIREQIKDRLIGVTTILVTHDLEDILAFQSQVAFIQQGRLVRQGSWTEIIEQTDSQFLERLGQQAWMRQLSQEK